MILDLNEEEINKILDKLEICKWIKKFMDLGFEFNEYIDTDYATCFENGMDCIAYINENFSSILGDGKMDDGLGINQQMLDKFGAKIDKKDYEYGGYVIIDNAFTKKAFLDNRITTIETSVQQLSKELYNVGADDIEVHCNKDSGILLLFEESFYDIENFLWALYDFIISIM